MTSSFSQYISTILTLGICVFICESICSSFSSGKILSKGLNLITSLCLFCVIIFPVMSSLKSCDIKADLPKAEGTQPQNSINLLEELTENDTQNTICAMIFEKFGIQPEYIGIELNISQPDSSDIKVNVGLLQKDFIFAEKISNLIQENLGEHTTINIMKVDNEQE